ncbi:LL-diaminopimelate aminotransferase [Biomaibacter acetigenes]|uniref:LL-diaminopimelate aminotransferase n=1 Tax=Biomaibacter acetigenes TaxID=2316383 RepID=A0A3G2R352_9FIRM|nr:LL-diaminopimelate aminotransferase [Biomaibacter acetigenes]AYO29812.1 LL-diaminopimelate aminotransferase [Biomaibacter acetigenes]RKL64440.1 LL-diaminopimelate aminotransferase [Thermoanaerobacteraceae bacterium SP2]
MKVAERLNKIPPYISAQIDKKIAELRKKGVDVVTLGVGDPDLPTPDNIIEVMEKAIWEPAFHRYPDYEGSIEFRKAVAEYYERRFDVKLNPENEVMALIGSKEGIVNLTYAFVDHGDYALIPDPAYPVYKTATLFAGGIPYTMPLLKENNFLPDFTKIDTDIARKAKLMFLCYPNNPTSAVADKKFFEEAVEFAKTYDIVICNDSAYAEITYDGYESPSLLSVKGAEDIAIELGSLSKPYRMTGWRIGYAVGNRDIMKALGRIKTNVDSGQFTAIQKAAVEALTGPQDSLKELRSIFTARRDMMVSALKEMGFDVSAPKGTFYIWAPVPEGYSSMSFSEMLVEKAAVVVIPGNAYGEYGEGFFRISLTTPDDRIKEAIKRMKEIF